MALIGVAFGLGFLFGPAIGGMTSLLDLTARFPGLARYGLNPFSAPAICAALLSGFNLLRVIARLPETFPPGRRAATPDGAAGSALGRLLAVFRVRGSEVRLATLINFLFTLGFGGVEFTITFLAAERLGYGPAQNVRIFLFLGVVLILTQGVAARRLAPRLGEKTLTFVGLLLGLASFSVLSVAHGTALVFLGFLLLGAGSGLVNPALSALVSLSSPEAEQGQNLGSFRAAGSFARSVGPLLAALAYWKLGSMDAYLMGTAIVVAPLLLSLRLRRPAHPAPPAAAPLAAPAADAD
jgi:MFS family permease